ncbi:MAG: CDP-glucose 4,6-dehydratase [Anaerolineae bacterium]|nr:CDP-glucose 4,6-dehydratase [Anaerolineae bacterium]
MFNNVYRGKKVLITGNTGFKGSWLTVWLLNLGADVYGISNEVPTTPSMFETLKLRERISYHEHNITDFNAVRDLINKVKPDYIFHLAGQPIVHTAYVDPIGTFATNVMGTAHILEAVRQSNHPCKMVLITSDKVYDNVEWKWGYRETDPLGGKDPYSASKAGAEMAIKTFYHSYFKLPESKAQLVVCRAGNVVGGGDWAAKRLVPDCFRQWGAEQTVEIREPRATRPWQHVMEALSGYLHVGQQLTERPELNGEAYNFGPNTEKNYSVREVLEVLRKYWEFDGAQEPIRYVENNKYHEAGLLKLNCDKVNFDLKWHAILSLEELGRMTAEWYFAFYRGKGTDMFAYTQAQLAEYTKLAMERDCVWAQPVAEPTAVSA